MEKSSLPKLSIIILYILMASATQQAQDWLEIVSIYPESPAVLRPDQKLSVRVDYELNSVRKAYIFVRPYTNGKKSDGYSAHPSLDYYMGSGETMGWFEFSNDAYVDEIGILMLDAETRAVLQEKFLQVDFQWIYNADIRDNADIYNPQYKNQDRLKIISLCPESPAFLRPGQQLSVSVDYEINSVKKAYIFVRPYTNGRKPDGYSAHPSPEYYRGSGETMGWFEFSNDAYVDEIGILMEDVETRAVLREIFLQVDFQWKD